MFTCVIYNGVVWRNGYIYVDKKKFVKPKIINLVCRAESYLNVTTYCFSECAEDWEKIGKDKPSNIGTQKRCSSLCLNINQKLNDYD